jgi:hypothetical protein
VSIAGHELADECIAMYLQREREHPGREVFKSVVAALARRLERRFPRALWQTLSEEALTMARRFGIDLLVAHVGAPAGDETQVEHVARLVLRRLGLPDIPGVTPVRMA